MRPTALSAKLALSACAVLAAFAGGLALPLAAAVLAVTFLLAPGWVLAPLLWRPGAEGRAAAAIALSPLLVGAPLALGLLAGVPLPLAARGLALVLAVLVWVVPGPRTASTWDAPAGVAFAAAALAALVVALALFGNPVLAPRADGWFHAAVTLQVLDRGIPPEDPYFAGVRLLYFWGAHVWAAAWLALAPGLSVYTPFILFNVAAAVAVVLAVAALARRFGADARTAGLTIGVLTLGYSPFCWGLVVGSGFLRHAPGWTKFAGLLDHGIDALLYVLARGQLHGSMVFFGDKYLVLTQFSLAFALLVIAVTLLLDLASEPRARTALALGLVVAGTLFIHTVAGYTLLVAAGVTWAWCALAALRGEERARAVLAPLALAVGVPLVLLAPYLAEITLGKHGQLRLGITLPSAVTLLWGGALYVGPGLAWLGARARRSLDARLLALIALVLLVLALCLQLPESNQSKFYNIAFLVLAVPAARWWAERFVRWRPAPRAWLAAALLVAVVPTQVLLAWGCVRERAQAPGAAWPAPAPGVRAAMLWARTHTPPDAAFCDLGGGRELLTVAGRSVLWGGFAGERDFGYEPAALQARRELVGALCRGREPGVAGAQLLRGLGREVIVMTRSGAPDSLADHGLLAARPERFEKLWRNESIAFWRVREP